MNVVDQPRYDAIYYNQTQVGAHPVVSMVYDSDGRRVLYGHIANGEMVKAFAQDIIANPSMFLAPCGKPYHIVGSTVENPCQDEIPSPKVAIVEGKEEQGEQEEPDMPEPVNLIDFLTRAMQLFGTESSARKIIAAGITSEKQLNAMPPKEIQKLVGPKSYALYRRQTSHA